MTDQDPQFGPLRRLDPAESEEQDVGRLEPMDPEADEASEPEATAVPVAAPPAPPGRLRDGLAVAVALAVLLSLSSIAAIGGLVAISMSPSVAPAGPASIAPVESASAPVVIRVGENAQGREEPEPKESPAEEPGQVAIPQPVAPQPVAPDNAGGGGDGQGGGTGGNGGGKSTDVEGAWCDARPGSACDATVGGGVLAPGADYEGDGYIGSDEPLPDDDGADWDDDGSTGHGSASHSKGRPGH